MELVTSWLERTDKGGGELKFQGRILETMEKVRGGWTRQEGGGMGRGADVAHEERASNLKTPKGAGKQKRA
ncbi:hypothetical protein AMTR_s00023p00049020 [Amborella trichopoda]|uniref:Uncharacterized protein n=1 Tax=Amborella trichopoda TaxID=13333 RepID=W1NK31_AMBTC|nr:hypothetical protein AMTR_s00023p00049020 [Amborella trichopoda]